MGSKKKKEVGHCQFSMILSIKYYMYTINNGNLFIQYLYPPILLIKNIELCENQPLKICTCCQSHTKIQYPLMKVITVYTNTIIFMYLCFSRKM